MANRFSQFFARSKHNAGRKVAILDPETGKDSGQWLLVAGNESDAYRAADHAIRNRMVEFMGKALDGVHPDKRDEAAKAASADWNGRSDAHTRELCAACVIDTSMGKPDDEELRELFAETPSLMDRVRDAIYDSASFFRGGSTSSVDSPSSNGT